MVTLIIVLVLLAVPYLAFRLIGARRQRPEFAEFGGVLALSLAFGLFGVGHFALTTPM